MCRKKITINMLLHLTASLCLFLLTLLHSERPKLYTILAFLSAVGLKWYKLERAIRQCADKKNHNSAYCNFSSDLISASFQLLIKYFNKNILFPFPLQQCAVDRTKVWEWKLRHTYYSYFCINHRSLRSLESPCYRNSKETSHCILVLC